MADEETRQEEQQQILVLELAGAKYGFPADPVKEIIRIVEITPVPESPPYLKGFIDFRGDMAVIIDLTERLGLGELEYDLGTQIVIIEALGHLVGLVVERVLDVISVPKSDIMEPKGQLPLPKDLVAGAYEYGERLLVLLDLEKALEAKGSEAITKAKDKAKK